jgi:hypothetical protein
MVTVPFHDVQNDIGSLNGKINKWHQNAFSKSRGGTCQAWSAAASRFAAFVCKSTDGSSIFHSEHLKFCEFGSICIASYYLRSCLF